MDNARLKLQCGGRDSDECGWLDDMPPALTFTECHYLHSVKQEHLHKAEKGSHNLHI